MTRHPIVWLSQRQAKAIDTYMTNYHIETKLMENNRHEHSNQVVDGVPLPIVTLNRWLFTVGPLLGFVLDVPLITTLLLIIDLMPLLFGRAWSVTGWVGQLLFAGRLSSAELEDGRVITFNRMLVVMLLVGAQVAFWCNAPVVGWFMALMVASANGLALAGFCVGCFLYYNFKIYRFRFFGAGRLSSTR
jgi:hypothetical protein